MKNKSREMRDNFCKMFSFDPNCFTINSIQTTENGIRMKKNEKKGKKKSKKGKRKLSNFQFESTPRITLQSTCNEHLFQEMNISKKEIAIGKIAAITVTTLAKYTMKKNQKQKQRKIKIKSLPWTQMYVREYNSHNPLCQEMW